MKFKIFTIFFLACVFGIQAQENYGATDFGMLEGPYYVPSIAEQKASGILIAADNSPMLGQPKRKHGNNVVPGKGSDGNDPLVNLQRNAQQQRVQPPILTFVADISQATPSDPTGAAGPNHYVAAWNSAFRIFDKNGNPLTNELSLGTLFPGNTIGDPIVFYDAEADRFVITEFDNNPNGFNVAVSQGSDPVTSGWHVYTTGFGTGSFPDYTKFSVFGDKYMVTANIANNNRVFAVERNEMLDGNPAQFVALPLPGISTSGFYSPQAFHTTDDVLAPNNAPAPIVYLQDDAWGGVSDDHLKVWNATIDWNNPGGATMSAAQEITTADFVSVFDGGSFSNRPQGGGIDIDILQATIMNQAQYRRFPTYNSVVFNFVVDVVAGGGEKAAIRWYELRQVGGDTQPWTIHQEGTYEAPDGRDAYSGSMVMNSVGDIAMGYTSSSSTDRISIRYTGQLASLNTPNVMNVAEELIAQSTAANPSNRLADYVQCTVDPVDDTFWHIAEYFEPSRRDVVAHFSLEPPMPDDIGVVSIDEPNSGVLTATEDIVITIRNFGSNDITDPSVQYIIDTGTPVVETATTGTIAAGATAQYTFTTQADLSGVGPFVIEASTLLTGDTDPSNDTATKTVEQVVGVCMPTAIEGCNVDGIKRFVLGDIDADDGGDGCNTEPAGSPQGYADRTDLSTNLSRLSGSNVHILQAQQNWTGGPGVEALSVWIDFDDSETFEPSEQLIAGEFFQDDNVLEDFILTIPTGATLGSHILRAKAIDTSAGGDINDPCTDFDFGEVQDYTVVIDESLGTQDNLFTDSDFMILHKGNQQYEITLTTTDFDGVAAIAVYNTLGQMVTFNNISKTGNTYTYQLDMSYAASGLYLVKMGDERSRSFVTGKIIVE